MANDTSTKKPSRLRRHLKRILLALCALLGALAAVGYVVLDRMHRGPPLPVCSAPALPRKAFGKPTQVTGQKSPGHYTNEPGAALLPDGSVALVYQAHNGVFSANDLGVATVGPEGHVKEGSYRSDRKRHFDAWMTADPKGKLHMVWLGHNGGRPDKQSQVAYAESSDGLTWSAPVRVNDVDTDCPHEMPGCLDKPMIAWAGDAALVLYYSEAAESMKAVRVGEGGRVLGPSVPVGSGAYGDVSVAASGAIHVVYVTSNEEGAGNYGDKRVRVEHTHSEDGGKTFAKPVRVSAEGEPVPFLFSNAQVAADEARGFLYVVYPSGLGDGQWTIVLATSRDGGKTWTRTKANDDAPCANHMTPRAVLDPRTGTLHVIWLENRTGKGGVAYAACEPGGARCSANEAVNEAPFASYTFARHRIDWLGEYPALLLDAERRTLHAVWTQTVDEDGDAVARIFHARAALP